MYHFTADHPPEAVRLSYHALIPGHICQYLKEFQIDAVRFMHKFLSKGEFCIYNDESGLGKQTAVAVLLVAACSSRKSLIVVQNDDRYVNGWEFHFNVLTNVKVMVIKDGKDFMDSPNNIYIAKWSTLRTIDDLNTFKFDCIILDNRGQMLSNNFCTSMLLKHYERKINILISSVDITSDLKLLHNALRLGGRLDPQFSSFKTFEEKFKLPDAKELAFKKVDLEEYFCKRERLADYCKTFRLRRYCHQFETMLPLVKEDRYKINLNLWREKQHAINFESNDIEFLNNHNREDEHIKDTQELFEEYCRQRRKQHLQFQQEEEQQLQKKEREILRNLHDEKEIVYDVDDEVALINDKFSVVSEKPQMAIDNSDEPILMSPLLLMSDSDTEDMPQVCNNKDIEIVDLSSEENNEQEKDSKGSKVDTNGKFSDNNKVCKVKKNKKRYELLRLEENIVDALKIINTPKRSTRNAKRENLDFSTKILKNRLRERNIKLKEKTPKSIRNKKEPINSKILFKKTSPSLSSSIKTSERSQSRNSTSKTHKESKKAIKNLPKLLKNNYITPKCSKNIEKITKQPSFLSTKAESHFENKKSKFDFKEIKEISVNTMLRTFRKTRSMDKLQNNKNPIIVSKYRVRVKQEPVQATPKTDANVKTKSDGGRSKRVIDITSVDVHYKHTRSMSRLTRSASGSKYLTRNISLETKKSKKKPTDTKVHKSTTHKRKTAAKDKPKDADKNTQISVISHKSSQDYESIQCAQRLSDTGIFDNDIEKTTEFIVPPTPPTLKNSFLSSSLTPSAGFLTESEIIFVPPSVPINAINNKKDEVILLSSSDNENSTSQSSTKILSSTSRRTRALKQKRLQKHSTVEVSKVPTFSELLAQQNMRSSTKSPDLFSNCSDLIQLPCSQPNLDSEEPNAPFEGFKIFGSEVKQLQQHYASAKSNATKQNFSIKKSYRDRSCLDILEKMFEPSIRKEKQIVIKKLSTTTPTNETDIASGNKSQNQRLILPSHPVEALTEVRDQQERQSRKRSSTSLALQDDDIFEITSNGIFGNVMRLHSNGDISPIQHTHKNNTTQHNKITNYLIGSLPQNGSGFILQDEAIASNGNIGGNNTEAGTPSKRHQPATQNAHLKKSPKSKNTSTQITKLTKWFTKPSETNLKKTPTKQVEHNEILNIALSSPIGKRAFKRRRLEFSKNV